MKNEEQKVELPTKAGIAQNAVLPAVKIGRNVHQVKSGDYVQYNGSCYLLCAGDGRWMSGRGWNMLDYVTLTAKALKELALSELKHVKLKRNGYDLERWYF